MVIKKTPLEKESKYVRDRKFRVNESWNIYLKNLDGSNFNRKEMVDMMDEVNSIDYLIIRHRRRDLLG